MISVRYKYVLFYFFVKKKLKYFIYFSNSNILVCNFLDLERINLFRCMYMEIIVLLNELFAYRTRWWNKSSSLTEVPLYLLIVSYVIRLFIKVRRNPCNFNKYKTLKIYK